MNSLETHTRNFTNCFLKDWKSLTTEEQGLLHKRACALNKNFTFTKKRLLKLKQLSDMLKAEELRIKAHTERIYEIQDKYVTEKLIDDYEVDITFECWNSDYYRKLSRGFQGNPFSQLKR